MTTLAKTVSIADFVAELRKFPDAAFDQTEQIWKFLQDTPVASDSLVPYLTWDVQHYTREQNCWMAVPIGRLQVENFHVLHQDVDAGVCKLEPTDTIEMNISQPC